LDWLRGPILQLLQAVAIEALPLDQARRRRARELAAALRRELDESLTAASSLLPPQATGRLVPAEAGSAGLPVFDVMGHPNELTDQDRSSLIAILDLLARQAGLSRIGVTISDATDRGTVSVVIVATGDPPTIPDGLSALLVELDSRSWLEQQSLVIEYERVAMAGLARRSSLMEA
jgi:hypothetical protein